MGQNCHVLKDDRTRLFLVIKIDNGESFTGYQLIKSQSVNHNRNSIIGNIYKN
jgi:hypothetical protein